MGSGRIEIIEHTADIALRIHGERREDLFEQGACGVYQVLGRLVGTGSQQDHRIVLKAQNLIYLFHDWLSEILYWFDVRQTIFESFEFSVLQDQRLEAQVKGRKLDVDSSNIQTEIKAITYHKLDIETHPDELVATVILDV